MFRRRRTTGNEQESAELDRGEEGLAGTDVEAPAAAEPQPVGHPAGPWDVADLTDDLGRFDLGGLRLAVPESGSVQLEVGEGMLLPTVVTDSGALQLSAFAAPRREGIWAEVRAEIAEALRHDGGTAEEVDGPFGPELLAQVPVAAPDGTVALQPARFLGVDGPRWFLRGLVTGPAATDPAAAAVLEDAFRQTVVVRGSDAMAPRDPIALRVPRDVLDAAGVPTDQQHAFDPFERGPEITEVR